MQIPFIVISYGDFAKSKKLFSYEREGIHTLPIFTEAETALRFCRGMESVLRRQFKDRRPLMTQLCTDPQKALDMFQVVTAYVPDLIQAVINPWPPVRDDENFDTTHLSIIDYVRPIDEVIEEIQELVEKSKEESKTPNSSEHS